MTTGDEDAVMAVLTSHKHQGSLEQRMEQAKVKLETYRESSLLKKMAQFLKALEPRVHQEGSIHLALLHRKVALGRTSGDETAEGKGTSPFEVRWLLCGI